LNIIKGPAEVTKMIKQCIKEEITSEGLLKNVETFVPSYRMDEELEEPIIWLFEHETTVADGKSGRLSRKLLLRTPFEFVCVVYDDDDIEQSELLGKELASRVAASIARNIKRVNTNNEIIFENLKFEALYPVGTVSVVGKSNKAPATSVRLIVEYYVDWAMCCKKDFKINDLGE